MKVRSNVFVFLAFITAAFCATAVAQIVVSPPAGGAPRPIAEKTVDVLPTGPLYWSVRSFKTVEQAQQASGMYGLAAETGGKAWLFTLGPKAESFGSGAVVAEAGPIVPPQSSRFLLRISESISVPGRATPVHTHPGSEAFYVLKGEIEYKTAAKTFTVSAGNASAGPPPNTVMQATTKGNGDAHNLIMFVLDADKPAQAPANF